MRGKLKQERREWGGFKGFDVQRDRLAIYNNIIAYSIYNIIYIYIYTPKIVQILHSRDRRKKIKKGHKKEKNMKVHNIP